MAKAKKAKKVAKSEKREYKTEAAAKAQKTLWERVSSQEKEERPLFDEGIDV